LVGNVGSETATSRVFYLDGPGMPWCRRTPSMFSQACVQVPADKADEYVVFRFTPVLPKLPSASGK
jgi:hypothetical protein